MRDVDSLSVDQIIKAMSAASTKSRAAFIEACPAAAMKEQALLAAGMDSPEFRAQALDFLAAGYAASGPYDVGSKIAEACYRLARRDYERGVGSRDVCRMIAGRGALNWMTCLQHLGRHSEIVTLIREPVQWLESIGDSDNLDMLRLKRVEAELDRENYDEAERSLNTIVEASLPPMVAVNYRLLKDRIEKHTGGGTELRREVPPSTPDDLKRALEPLIGKLLDGVSPESQGNLGQVRPDTLRKAVERVFGGAVNELTVGQRVVEATSLFRDEVRGRDPVEIRKVEPVLVAARDWLAANNFPDSENDARWGLYLCYSRTGRDDLAVAELQRMRANIERARSSIHDPLERARLSERYPYLHAVECALLCKLGRDEQVLEAIEASKGRGLADLQTQRDGRAADETEFAAAVRAVPSYMQRLSSHYLTMFVDEDAVYCSLVTSDGRIHSSQVDMTKEQLTELARALDPRLWGEPDPADLLGPRFPVDVPKRLSALVDWLAPLLDAGVMREGDHLCYSPHDVLLLVPFHYLELQGRTMVDLFSISRAHGAHSLIEVLEHEPRRPESCLVVEVPSLQDLDDKAKVEAFRHAAQWLGARFPHVDCLYGEQGSLAELSARNLSGRVLHFATHGRFPEQDTPGGDPNPFRASGLVLAADGRLPDLMAVAKGRGAEHVLTPERAFRSRLDLAASHLTLQACVSGLSKTGYGGDALGLEWACLVLGAVSVLSTHWHASAQTTARFVERFYDHWLVKEESRASAWRRAVLALRGDRATSDPYHWAAFSLTGDWR
jgi:hypothetical protein